jgi:hypothetical protein
MRAATTATARCSIAATTAVFVSPTSCYTYNMDGRFAQKPYIAERARVMKEGAKRFARLFAERAAAADSPIAKFLDMRKL